jgi:sugar phosphate isomerase/epimerase
MRVTKPLDANKLIDLAVAWELTSVEMPLSSMLPTVDENSVDQLRERLQEARLGLVVDTSVIDVDALRTTLPLAARAGAKVVRAMVSPMLEGARAQFPGGWDVHFQEIRRRVIEVRPLLEEYDLILAIEDHQDVTSDDLLVLCDAGGPRVGVTLDVANPLAVGEEPLEFARKVGPLIYDVHLKDYTIHATPSGYRLVRAAIGDGVIPWPELLPLLREIAPHAMWNIELAALYGRHIRLLDNDWWEGYPPTDVRQALPALRFMAQHARPADSPWHTPWELEQPPDDVARWEMEQFEQSVHYLRLIGADR